MGSPGREGDGARGGNKWGLPWSEPSWSPLGASRTALSLLPWLSPAGDAGEGMESEPPTWDLLQLHLSRQLPHLIIPAQPSSRNEELGAQGCGFVVC